MTFRGMTVVAAALALSGCAQVRGVVDDIGGPSVNAPRAGGVYDANGNLVYSGNGPLYDAQGNVVVTAPQPAPVYSNATTYPSATTYPGSTVYAQPTYSQPTYSAPTVSAPTYSTGVYSTPQPTYTPSMPSAPTYSTSVPSAPTYTTAGVASPRFDANGNLITDGAADAQLQAAIDAANRADFSGGSIATGPTYAGSTQTYSTPTASPAPTVSYSGGAAGGGVGGAIPQGFQLAGTSWRLASIGGAPVSSQVDLHFDGANGTAGGQGPCNLYGGRFNEAGGGAVSITGVFSTERACGELQTEKQYLAALEQAARYSTNPATTELVLLNGAGAPVASFNIF